MCVCCVQSFHPSFFTVLRAELAQKLHKRFKQPNLSPAQQENMEALVDDVLARVDAASQLRIAAADEARRSAMQ